MFRVCLRLAARFLVGGCVFVKFLHICALYSGEICVGFVIFSEPVSMCIVCCQVISWFCSFQ